MRLKRFKVQNYKIIDDTGWIGVDELVTALVGKNESGKTAVLRALWKSRNKASVDFDKLNDYPRDRYSRDRRGRQPVTSIEYSLDADESNKVAALLGSENSRVTVVGQEAWYDGEDKTGRRFTFPEVEFMRRDAVEIARAVEGVIETIQTTHPDFVEPLSVSAQKCIKETSDGSRIWHAENINALIAFQKTLQDVAKADNELVEAKAKIADVLAIAKNGDPLVELEKWVNEKMPYFIYFDDYGQLETRIYLPGYLSRLTKPDGKTRTQRALFSRSGIEPQEILTLGRVRDSGEADEIVQRRKDKRRALLQSASFGLTGDWVDWWAEKRHRLHFDADGEDLVLQVSDEKREFPIPFEERSQGFQWFFSFYLIFQVESEDQHLDATLLLDEPGLHLHPMLQQKLIAFFDRVAARNQLVYSTHLPFLIDGDHLDRVRTVYLDSKTEKTVVSPDIRAGADYDTLFPIQAALGYSIAQTLFVGKKCLVVEGITDYWILKALDEQLRRSTGSDALDPEIVIVPAGGTSRLMPLASLMFGAAGVGGKNMVVLLDSDKEGMNAKVRLNADLFASESRVVLLGDAIGKPKATIEDLVTLDTYEGALVKAGYQVSFDSSERVSPSNSEASAIAFSRLNIGPFDHTVKTKVALQFVNDWGKNADQIPTETIERAKRLFRMINARFQ